MSSRLYGRLAAGAAVLALGAGFIEPGGARADTAADQGAWVLTQICAECHAPSEDGPMGRIDAARKTPEAWDMTVVRMMRDHGVALTAEERRAVVRRLADTRGLSVAETAGWRYTLEREPVAVDEGPDTLMTEMCARCHSYSRVAMQRRSAQDWERLIHFHLGQFPTLEYQALGRDRDWWGVATTEVLDFLSAAYPLGEAPAPLAEDASGDYVVAGHAPGRGAYRGTMRVSRGGEDYDVETVLEFPDGAETYAGSAVIHGAGEWRGALASGDVAIRQILAYEDGRLSGRWHLADQDVSGGRMEAVRVDAAPQIVALLPSALPVGVPTEIAFVGVGLGGALRLPDGATAEIVARSDTEVVATVLAEREGALAVMLGALEAPVDLVAYEAVDRIAVVPDVAIARIGGAGGPIPKTPAQFEAVGFADGPDGAPGTADDLPLGRLDVAWSIDDWDAGAAATEDAKYAGSIGPDGLFTPAGAGPNPERFMGTNNVGNLRVTATYGEGDAALRADAQLYATVQRYVDPPIR